MTNKTGHKMAEKYYAEWFDTLPIGYEFTIHDAYSAINNICNNRHYELRNPAQATYIIRKLGNVEVQKAPKHILYKKINERESNDN